MRTLAASGAGCSASFARGAPLAAAAPPAEAAQSDRGGGEERATGHRPTLPAALSRRRVETTAAIDVAVRSCHAMAVTRCEWAEGSSEAMLAYHDEEWGVPSHDERHLFELLTLEGAQAGLSWSTILNKRDGYRRAFAGFDPAAVARFGPDDVERLLGDPGIVRNRLKVESTVANAGAILELEQLRRLPLELVGGEPLVGRLGRASRSCPPRPSSRARSRAT